MHKTKGKNKKHISKIQKTQMQNKRGTKREKKESQKGVKHVENMVLSICSFFAFILLSWFAVFFAFILHLFCFLPGKKQNKCKIKAKKTANQKSKITEKMQMDKFIFFSHVIPLFDVPFFPMYFASVFLSFEVVLFDFPCVFLFFCIFSS